MDPAHQSGPRCPLSRIPEASSPSPNQPPIPTLVPKSLPSGSHDDKGTNLDQRSHFAETPKAPGNHAPAVCPPLSLYRYLAYPYLHEMRALGLPALVLPPGTPSASVPPTKSPCPSAESGVPTPPGPADSPTHENLAPRRESLPSADSSISLSPSAPACSSSEDDMESGVDLLGLARASRREGKTKRRLRREGVTKLRKREERKRSKN